MAAVFRRPNNPHGRAEESTLRRAKNAAAKAASPSRIELARFPGPPFSDSLGTAPIAGPAGTRCWGGAARLVDALLTAGYTDLTVLDLSEAALAAARARLAAAGDGVHWIV